MTLLRPELSYTKARGWLIRYVDPDNGKLLGTSADWPGHPHLGLLGRGARKRVRAIADAMIDGFERFVIEWAAEQRPRIRVVR